MQVALSRRLSIGQQSQAPSVALSSASPSGQTRFLGMVGEGPLGDIGCGFGCAHEQACQLVTDRTRSGQLGLHLKGRRSVQRVDPGCRALEGASRDPGAFRRHTRSAGRHAWVGRCARWWSCFPANPQTIPRHAAMVAEAVACADGAWRDFRRAPSWAPLRTKAGRPIPQRVLARSSDPHQRPCAYACFALAGKTHSEEAPSAGSPARPPTHGPQDQLGVRSRCARRTWIVGGGAQRCLEVHLALCGVASESWSLRAWSLTRVGATGWFSVGNVAGLGASEAAQPRWISAMWIFSSVLPRGASHLVRVTTSCFEM